MLALFASTANATTIDIKSAEDLGNGHDKYIAANAIDGDTEWGSRWAASGTPVNLVLQLGAIQTVGEVGIVWGRGGERSYEFEIWAYVNSTDSWTKVYSADSSGKNADIEVYDIGNINTDQIRITALSNSAGTQWTDILEVEIYAGTETNQTVVMQKQNTNFSIDGNKGGKESQQLYLWSTDTENENQQWIEMSQGDGYYTYQKINTSVCVDGGEGAGNRQAVTLEACDEENENQHWLKVALDNGSFRLEKRNSAFSIDGNAGAENSQEIYLWESDDQNVNQQWEFSATDTVIDNTEVDDTEVDNEVPDEIKAEAPPNSSEWVLDASNNQNDLLNAVDASTSSRWTTEEVQDNSQWLSIDLSRESSFNTISLNSNDSADDYPRSYAVYTSEDGKNWGAAIATGQGSSGTTAITFDDVSARYIQIAQTGSSSESWWSIHDLSVSLETEITTDIPTQASDWTVDSLSGLRDAVQLNNQTIKLRAGNYSISSIPEADRSFVVSGDNNIIDLTDVHIDFPVDETSEPHFIFLGAGNTLKNGTLENSYPNGEEKITDFVSYNLDRNNLANGADVHMKITGDNNTVIGTKMTVRGSFPFGYGSLFGIGSTNSFGLNKRGGIQIGGKNTLIDGIELYLHAFGHGIYMQNPADNTTIRNSLVEGLVRETNDMLAEGRGSLPFLNDYLDADGVAIPSNEMESLAEDGIRAYGSSGSVTVENCVVRKMRGGIRLYLASSATVSNTVGIDNGATNFNMPTGGTITNSSGNFTNAPLNDFRLSRSRQNLEMTILPSPNAVGSHNIADIQGDDHNIVFYRADGPEDSEEVREIVVSGNNSTIRNETEYRIVLEAGTKGNTIISAGDVTDNGSNNITRIDLVL